MGNKNSVPNSYLRILENQKIRNHCFDLVKTYSYTIAKCCNLIGYATRYLFVNGYRVAASNATRPSFSPKNAFFFLFFFLNNLEEINTTLFLLKQLDYLLSISMKRLSTRASPSLTIIT